MAVEVVVPHIREKRGDTKVVLIGSRHWLEKVVVGASRSKVEVTDSNERWWSMMDLRREGRAMERGERMREIGFRVK